MSERDIVTLGHGSGGLWTRDLVREVFQKHLGNPYLDALGDSAVVPGISGLLAVTTDAFVVSPLFFEGGDIGTLSVFGTVNDLAVAGAVPLHLTAAFVLEEGLAIADLERIAVSMARAARHAGVTVVAGDTKVVERGHGDGVFIVTSGLGRMREEAPPGPLALRPGDAVLVSGPVGDHGAVIAAHRMGLDLAGGLQSDCGPVTPLVDALYAAGVRPRFLRDPTRGGLATVLAEAAREARLTIHVEEERVPVRDGVAAVCEILGLDPLYLACEGRVVAVVSPEDRDAAVSAWEAVTGGLARVCGEVGERGPGPVLVRTRLGGLRICDLLASEPLPRIC